MIEILRFEVKCVNGEEQGKEISWLELLELGSMMKKVTWKLAADTLQPSPW